MLRIYLVGLALSFIGCQSIKDSYKRFSGNGPPACDESKGKCDFETTRTYLELPEHYKNCSSKGTSDYECMRSFFEVLGSRLAYRYSKADFDRGILWCQSEPKICNFGDVHGANAFEEWIKESHENNHNRASSQKSLNIVGTILKGMGDGMSGGK